MFERLRDHYQIHDAGVLEAMRSVPRHAFVPEALQGRAYGDHALPISGSQTISQPYIVARMTELLKQDKYQPDTVRAFRLEPHPGTFNRGVVTNGWGFPDRMGRENGQDIFLYREGLLVYFDEAGWNAKLMVFTVPQPRDPTEEPRSR